MTGLAIILGYLLGMSLTYFVIKYLYGRYGHEDIHDFFNHAAPLFVLIWPVYIMILPTIPVWKVLGKLFRDAGNRFEHLGFQHGKTKKGNKE